MTNKILTSMALAGGLFAGSLNAFAQAEVQPIKADLISAPSTVTFTPAGRPGIEGDVVPIDKVIALPDFIDAVPVPMPRPLPDFQISDTDITIDAGIPLRPDASTIPLDPKQLTNVVEIGAPTRILWLPAGEPFTPVTTDAGVVIAEADVASIRPGTVAPLPEGVVTLSVVQQFDLQRSAELTARATALEQLRTANPDQRAEMIAVMTATQLTQAAEQRELARELRSELRALREERKGN